MELEKRDLYLIVDQLQDIARQLEKVDMEVLDIGDVLQGTDDYLVDVIYTASDVTLQARQALDKVTKELKEAVQETKAFYYMG